MCYTKSSISTFKAAVCANDIDIAAGGRHQAVERHIAVKCLSQLHKWQARALDTTRGT